MNMQDLMVVRDGESRTVHKYLMSHEVRFVAVRQHPAVLLFPVLLAVAGLVLAGFASTVGLWVAWWLWLGLLAYTLWKVIAWSVQFFVVSEHRVMLITGVFNRKVAMMPAGKVTDIRFDRPILGRMLGYGSFTVETAGDTQAFREVHFMPYPEQLYLEVSSVVFGTEDESPD